MRLLVSAILVLLLGSAAPAQDGDASFLFQEGFGGVADGSLPRGWKVLTGTWKVHDGELIGENLDGEAQILLPVDGSKAREFRVEATVRFLAVKNSRRWLGVSFGFQSDADPDDDVKHHSFTMRQEATLSDGVEHAMRDPRGRWRVLGKGSTREPLALGTAHRLRLECVRGRVRLWVDQDLIVDDFLAPDVPRGGLGLHLSSAKASFDGLTVAAFGDGEAEALRPRLGPLRRVITIAHRGASRDAPENTLSALRLALQRGADGVEFDVYRAKDGELVLMHDKTLVRTTDFLRVFPHLKDEKAAGVSALTVEELKRLDAGSWKSPAYRGERIPTLSDALEVLRGRATPVVEIKPVDIGRDVARVIRRLGMEHEVFVQSFSAQAIREFHEELPSVATGFLTGEKVSMDPIVRARKHLEGARRAGANAIVCNYRLAAPEYVREIHRHAVAVWVYTVDDKRLMNRLIRLGVDGIITDVPATLSALTRNER